MRRAWIVLFSLGGVASLWLPWYVSSLGDGGFRFFMHWLTKYPNFGPINYKVALGMVCIVVSSCGAMLLLLHNAVVRRRRPWRIFLMTGIAVGCWIGVLEHLDIRAVQLAIDRRMPYYVIGPILRGAAMGTMLTMALRPVWRRL